MADQASMTNGPDVRIHSPFTEGVIGNIAEFGNDTVELIELQAKLAAHDLKQFSARAAIHAALAGIGVLLIVGLVPVALAGIGLVLHEQFNLSPGVALLITAGLALVLAGILATIAYFGIRRSFGSFDRSSEEFTRNFAWIKTVLANTGRQPVKHKGAQTWRRST